MEGYMTLITPVILITVGAFVAIIRGVLGKGIGSGRGRFILDKFGPGIARTINIVFGLLILALGVLMLLYPEWFAIGKE